MTRSKSGSEFSHRRRKQQETPKPLPQSSSKSSRGDALRTAKPSVSSAETAQKPFKTSRPGDHSANTSKESLHDARSSSRATDAAVSRDAPRDYVMQSNAPAIHKRRDSRSSSVSSVQETRDRPVTNLFRSTTAEDMVSRSLASKRGDIAASVSDSAAEEVDDSSYVFAACASCEGTPSA